VLYRLGHRVERRQQLDPGSAEGNRDVSRLTPDEQEFSQWP
jgi:hypothetical protein